MRRRRTSTSTSPTSVTFGPTKDVFFSAVWSFLESHQLDRAIRLRVPHIQTIKSLVLAGAGASILPDYTIREPGFVERSVEGLGVAQPIWVAVRPASAQIPLVAAFRAALVDGFPGLL